MTTTISVSETTKEQFDGERPERCNSADEFLGLLLDNYAGEDVHADGEIDEQALAEEITDHVAAGNIRIDPDAIADAVAKRVGGNNTVTLEASERRAIAEEVAEVLQR